MSFFDELLKLLPPAVFIGAAIAYWFSIKQKRFDLNQEHYKKIRLTVSSLLSIWNEYAKLERFLKSDDPMNTSIYQAPELAEQFFGLNQRKLKKMNKTFLLSIENLKEIDVVLFHKLDGVLDDFNRVNKGMFFPLLEENLFEEDHKSEVVISLLDELLDSIEEIILDTVTFLPRKERRKVKKVLDKHLKDTKLRMNADNPESEVPEFFVKLINYKIKPKTLFTQDDFRTFYNDPTIQWVANKFMSFKSIRKIIFAKSGGMKLIFAFLSGNESYIHEAFSSFDESEFQISKEEALKFNNNKPLYKLIMGAALKAKGKVPMELKRTLVKLKRGDISLHTEHAEVLQNKDEN
ncbi:MAG: hypothetical protein ACO1N0_00680 [Fluviicola sp.]